LEKKLSIIIPCYNEERYIYTVLQRITGNRLPDDFIQEIIVIDDGSTDNTNSELEKFKREHLSTDLKIITHLKNQGKGACIVTGITNSDGSIIIIQDADLEYDPKDYNKMLSLFIDHQADVVYGSRFRGSEPHRVLFFMHTIGNKVLTFVSNMLTQLNLTDMESGYKMFKADVLKKINLQEKRFGFEPEVTAKISRIKGIRVYEVGIAYHGRTYADGKKIKWQDGLRAFYCIFKYNLFTRK
jgi:glycosyltransferase involved in cell wall biosynthesis